MREQTISSRTAYLRAYLRSRTAGAQKRARFSIHLSTIFGSVLFVLLISYAFNGDPVTAILWGLVIGFSSCEEAFNWYRCDIGRYIVNIQNPKRELDSSYILGDKTTLLWMFYIALGIAAGAVFSILINAWLEPQKWYWVICMWIGGIFLSIFAGFAVFVGLMVHRDLQK